MQSLRAKWFWVVLYPLSCLWAMITGFRRWKNNCGRSRAYQSKLKVICVGNIHSGGSGKTPLVKAIADHFQAAGVAVLSRGYRGELSSSGALVEKNKTNGAILYGDEPWMLANQLKAPVFIDSNRLRGIQTIEKERAARLVVLDDGFQNFSLQHNLDLVCLNSDKNLDDYCLPLGELRESLRGLSASDAIILTPGSDPSRLGVWMKWLTQQFPTKPVFNAELQIEGFFQGEESFEINSEQQLFSFCGIASPERFEALLKGFRPGARHLKSFSDHHHYTRTDLEQLFKYESFPDSVYITTDKDWYKVASICRDLNKTVVSLRTGYKMAPEFWAWIRSRLGEKFQ